MKDYFNKMICGIYTFLLKYRPLVFLFILIAWIISFFSFSQMQLKNSSADLLPHSSVTLQKMAQAMELAPFSRLFFIDIFHEEGNLVSLEQSAEKVIQAIPTEYLIFLSQEVDITPSELLQYIPNFFSEDAQRDFEKHLEPKPLEKSINVAIQMCSTLIHNTALTWLRGDPLNLKEIVLQKLPQVTLQKGGATPDNQNHPAIKYPLSKDKKHILLTFLPQISVHDTDIAKEIFEIIQNIPNLPEQIRINLNGSIVHTAVNTLTIEQDINTILLFSFLGISLLYCIFIRSWQGIWLLITPALAMSLSLGIMTSTNAFISGLALGFGATVLGLAEDYAVHIHCALEKEKNVEKVLAILSLPLFQGFILNISGFGILLFSAIPAIRQLAFFTILSLTFGYLIAIFIIPICPRSFNYKKNQTTRKKNQLSCNTVSSQVIFYSQKTQKILLPRTIFVVICLAFSSVFLFKHIPVDASPRSMGALLQPYGVDVEAFSKTWNENKQSMFLLEADNEEDLYEKARIFTAYIDEICLQKWQLEEGLIRTSAPSKVSTIAYFFLTKQEQEENIKRWQDFIAENSSNIIQNIETICHDYPISPVLFKPFFELLHKEPSLISSDNIEQSSLSSLVSFFTIQTKPRKNHGSNEKFYTILISPTEITLNEIHETLATDPLSSPPILVNYFFTDILELSPKALESEVERAFYEEARFLPLAFLVCFILLYLFSFHIGKTFLAIIPALFSVFSVLFVMFFSDTSLTLPALVGFLIIIGLALDHGVLLITDMEHGVNLGIKNALFISSASTLIGLGLLAFAQHPSLQAMGRVIFFGLLLEIPVSHYLLPLFCKR